MTELSKKKYILFDLDGTLTNPKEGITKCVQYALHAAGIEVPNLDDLLCFIGPPLRYSFAQYYGMNEADTDKAIEKYRERYSTIGLFENSAYEGIHEILEKLKEQGKILAVATSKPEIYTHKIIEKYGLKKYFDEVVGSELDGTRDNKWEVIEEVFSRLQLTQDKKAQIIMIGDRKHDIIGANKCGIESIGVEFGYAEEGELKEAGATYIVETVEELGKLLCTKEHD